MSVGVPSRSHRSLSVPDETLTHTVLPALCLAAFALIVVLSTRLAYFNDDWFFLLQRPGLESHGGIDTLLAPHNGNMVVVPAAIYKAIVAVFGMHAVWPYRVIQGASWAALGAVLHTYVRPRLGAVIARLAAAITLFLGPAWEAMLFFNGLNHAWAVALGLASLILLERDTPARNATACGLLTLGVAASNTALALTVGAAVAVLMRRRPRELWIVAVPLAVFASWWLGYGRGQPTGITAGHVAALPGYVFDAFSSGVATVLGLKDNRFPSLLASGHLPAVIVLGALAVWLLRGGRPRPQAWWIASGLIAFWLLAGASAIPGRAAPASRYQVTDGVLILATAAELLHGVRPSRAVLAGLVALSAAIVISNLILLHDGYVFLRIQSGYVAADTGALQLAGPAHPSDAWLLPDVAGNPYLQGITAKRYFAQTAAHGTPSFDTPAQLAAAPADQQAAADGVLIAAEAIRPTPISPRRAGAACTSAGARAATPLSTGSTTIENRGADAIVLLLSRFAPASRAHGVSFLPPHAAQTLTIPHDASPARWRLSAVDPRGGTVVVSVCRG